MWLVAPEPTEEWRIVLSSILEELIYICRIIRSANPCGQLLTLMFIIGSTRQLSRRTIHNPWIAGSATLTRKKDRVATLAKNLSKGLYIGWELVDVVASSAQLPRISPRKYTGSRRSRLCIWCITVRYKQTLSRQTVIIGGVDPRTACRSEVIKRSVVGYTEQYIWTLLGTTIFSTNYRCRQQNRAYRTAKEE